MAATPGVQPVSAERVAYALRTMPDVDESPAERLQRLFDHLVLRPVPRGVEYRCPVCANRAWHDGEGLEPCCTGPHPSLDEHPHEPMVRVQP